MQDLPDRCPIPISSHHHNICTKQLTARPSASPPPPVPPSAPPSPPALWALEVPSTGTCCQLDSP